LSCVLTLTFTIPNGYTATWSEGACIANSNVFEGATRDYYTRVTGHTWRKPLGDWLDKHFTPYGKIPFASFELEEGMAITTRTMTDVSDILKLWKTEVLENHGFYLNSRTNSGAQFYARDSSNQEFFAVLEVHKYNQTLKLIVNADTFLNPSTYTCQGNKTFLNTDYPVLVKFDLTDVPKDFDYAKLSLSIARPPKADVTIDVFAVDIEKMNYDASEGFLSKVVDMEQIQADPRVIYYESFDQKSLGYFKHIFNNHSSIVSVDSAENFLPISGKALKITVRENQHFGFSKHINIAPLKLNKAYFKYWLRLGNSWEPKDAVKLPGFAGINSGSGSAAGWGGRKSNGKNGWSARGFISPPVSSENNYANMHVLGSYLYHADMKDTYGDSLTWIYNDASIIHKNKWYEIEQYISLNTPSENDGVLRVWINGILVYNKTDIRLTDDENLPIESVWLNVYHGGISKAHKDISLYIDELIIAHNFMGKTQIVF
jgi:hypothetical protein